MALRYLVKRLAAGVGVLVGATIIIFLLVNAAGDPLGPLEQQQPPVPRAVIAAERLRLGLNKPLPERYLQWLAGVVHGNWGPSIDPATNIGQQLAQRIPVTMELVGTALVIAIILALVVGTIAAVRPYGIFDSLSTPTSFFLLALPSFWLAVLLKQLGILYNQRTETQTFYTVGSSSPNLAPGIGGYILNIAGHVILPTVTLALIHYASWSRYQRAAVLDSLSSDYVKSAVLRGLSYRQVLWHAVRPALIPVVTVIALDIPALLSGTVIVETVFQWNGMGAFLLQSITEDDPNAIMAWFLVAAAAVVGFNLIADLAYALLDPRIRYGT